jgi:Putative SAM-dependent methyltransferase
VILIRFLTVIFEKPDTPMYIDIVRAVLEEAVKLHASDSGLTGPEILGKISQHLYETSKQHRKAEPDIRYDDPLCRLGYLYRHATANATLFEWVLSRSKYLKTKLLEAKGGTLQICSVGGGPGTELLGLAKYLLQNSDRIPRKISFAVLDNFPQWSETWHQLAEKIEATLDAALAAKGKKSPIIADSFIHFDLLDKKSYKDYLHRFSKIDVVVFNYLFSENKSRLDEAVAAVKHLVKVTPSECVFVVIDRFEHDGEFSEGVSKVFTEAGFAKPKIHKIEGSLDSDEQAVDMGKLFNTLLGYPRVKFYTDYYRDPAVFWFEVIAN